MTPSGSTDSAAIQDDLAAFGLPPDAFGEIDKEENHFEVWEENWDTVITFISCQTQWKKEIPAMSGQVIWHGLDYNSVDVVIKRKGFKGEKANEIFEGIQLMEASALPLLNKPKK